MSLLCSDSEDFVPLCYILIKDSSQGFSHTSNKTQSPEHTSELYWQESPCQIPLPSTFPQFCLAPL